MIDYREDWLFLLVCRFKGSCTIRALYFAIPSTVLTFFLVYIDEIDSSWREDNRFFEVKSSQLWSACTMVLGVLLGFRTNRAMSRFWEGTGLLHQMRGEWFDSVSCCVTFSRAALSTKPDDVMRFRHTIVRLMSLCHGSALEEIAADRTEKIDTIDPQGLSNATLLHLRKCKEDHSFNRVEVILHMTQSIITKGLDDGVLKIPPPILSRVYQTLSRGFVNLLNAKKIADTRFPFPYAQLITMLLLMHVVLTPLLLSCLIRSLFFAPLFTFVPVFSMFYLNFVGVELENPFGDDDNDLPLGHFQSEMNNCLLMLLEENADLIADIHPTRCETNFEKLQQGVHNKCTSGGSGEAIRISRIFENAQETSESDAMSQTNEAFRAIAHQFSENRRPRGHGFAQLSQVPSSIISKANHQSATPPSCLDVATDLRLSLPPPSNGEARSDAMSLEPIKEPTGSISKNSSGGLEDSTSASAAAAQVSPPRQVQSAQSTLTHKLQLARAPRNSRNPSDEHSPGPPAASTGKALETDAAMPSSAGLSLASEENVSFR